MNAHNKPASSFRNLFIAGIAVCVMHVGSVQAVIVDVDNNIKFGFINVWELPDTTDGYVFGAVVPPPILTSEFNLPARKITLGTFTDPGDPLDPFWYIQDSDPANLGNKIVQANLYAEVHDGSLSGQTVTFMGEVLSNTFTDAHVATVWIRDFAPDYSSVITTFIDLQPGAFSIDLLTDPGAGRHVQYGFDVTGVNVWIDDADGFGTAMIRLVPEPGTIALFGLGLAGLCFTRRKKA